MREPVALCAASDPTRGAPAHAAMRSVMLMIGRRSGLARGSVNLRGFPTRPYL
jgi:hypothetical protein